MNHAITIGDLVTVIGLAFACLAIFASWRWYVVMKEYREAQEAMKRNDPEAG